MKVKVFAVLDAKLGSFSQPFFSMSQAAGIRAFSDSVNDASNPNNQWHNHPEDFTLYMLGEYDDLTATLIPELPVALITASNVFLTRSPREVIQ